MDESPVILRPQRYPHPVNCYRTSYGSWYVQMRVEGERVYLGTFATVEAAERARDEYRAWLRVARFGQAV